MNQQYDDVEDDDFVHDDSSNVFDDGGNDVDDDDDDDDDDVTHFVNQHMQLVLGLVTMLSSQKAKVSLPIIENTRKLQTKMCAFVWAWGRGVKFVCLFVCFNPHLLQSSV